MRQLLNRRAASSDVSAIRRLAWLSAVGAAVSVMASCGGGSETASPTASTATEESKPAWVEQRLAAVPGPDQELLMGTSDYSVGKNRVAFLVARPNNQIVQSPRATLEVGLESGDVRRYRARLVPLGVTEDDPSHDHSDAPPNIYVANVQLPRVGVWWLVVSPEGESIQAVGIAPAKPQSGAPAIGSRAYPSDNPTLEDATAPEITTANPPDTELLRFSIADSLKERVPFVVTFSTPKFCQTRTCGPTVEVVDAVRQRFEGRGIRFIHVEVYRNNDPQQGPNQWFGEWKLTTEPWVFLVDRSGRIRAKFEGSVSVAELQAAVRRHLQ